MAARLITEADVREGRAGNPIVVDAGTVITPSALDAAHARGIAVEYRRDAPRFGSNATPIANSTPAAPAPSPRDEHSASELDLAAPPLVKACGCETAGKCGCRSEPICSKPPSPEVRPSESKSTRESDWSLVLRDRGSRFDASAFQETGGTGERRGASPASLGRAVLTIDLSAGGLDAAIRALKALQAAGLDVGVELRKDA